MNFQWWVCFSGLRRCNVISDLWRDEILGSFYAQAGITVHGSWSSGSHLKIWSPCFFFFSTYFLWKLESTQPVGTSKYIFHQQSDRHVRFYSYSWKLKLSDFKMAVRNVDNIFMHQHCCLTRESEHHVRGLRHQSTAHNTGLGLLWNIRGKRSWRQLQVTER